VTFYLPAKVKPVCSLLVDNLVTISNYCFLGKIISSRSVFIHRLRTKCYSIASRIFLIDPANDAY